MEWLSQIYSSLFRSVDTFSAQTIRDQVIAFRNFLNGGAPPDNPVVRFWVEAGASYGHQSSTANLIYRLARPVDPQDLNFGYSGNIEIYYENPAELQKLQELIPELLNNPPRINNATLVPIQFVAPPAATVNFGFTGGANTAEDYAAKMNVRYFVRLQPYAWPGSEQVQRPGQQPVDLAAVPELGPGFNQRLFFLDPALYSNPPFGAFAANPKVPIAQYLTSANTLNDFQLLVTYSVKSGISRLNANPDFAAGLITGSVLKWQDASNAPKPVIILNFDDYGTPAASAENDLRAILQGNSAASEFNVSPALRNNNAELQLNFSRRLAFFTGINANARFTYLNYPNTLNAVQTALNPLRGQNNHVIWIQLGRTPPPVFSYCVFKSTLPALFEGQNTANLAINIGQPYMQVPAPNMNDQARLGVYPSVALTAINASEIAAALLRVASQISSSNAIWPERASDAPCLIVAQYYDQYLREGANGTIHNYFQTLQAFFAQAAKDKFALAIAYMNTLRAAPPVMLTSSAAAGFPYGETIVARPPTAVADTGLTLNQLYAKLQQDVVIGQPLNLVPGILTEGAIPAFVQSLLQKFGPTLTFNVSQFEHEGEPPAVTKITLAGPTTAFQSIGVDCDVRVVFNEPAGVLTADVKFANKQTWTMPGVPWIVLRDPYISTLIPNGQLPVSATFGGFYPALESKSPPITAQVEISVGAQDLWPATISFDQTFPSISAAFQLATSVNLVQKLPPPFNVLTDLGVASVQLQYNKASSTLESIAIVAKSNTKNLPLFGTLSVGNIEISTVLLNPAGSSTLSVTGSAEFRMGRTDPAVIGLSFSYPDLVLQGGLKEGTITIEKVLSTFLPQVQLSLPQVPQIDAFSFNYNKTTDYLNVTLNLNIQWKISFLGKDLFTIENAGFNITRNKGATTGAITGSTVLLPSTQKIGVDVSAFYQGAGVWQFEAKQTAGVVDLNSLLEEYLGKEWAPPVKFPQLDGLRLTIGWEKEGTSFEFAAKTASAWVPIDALPEVSAKADLLIGSDKNGRHGKIGSDLTLWNIDLRVDYDFDPKQQKLCVKWLFATACVAKQENGDTVAVFSLDDKSIGEMVEMFVSWATGSQFGLAAPWNLLNDIKLNGLSLTYNFTQKTVKFSVAIGPFDFGIFKITSIGLNYDPAAQQKVAIDVAGEFLWEMGDKKNNLSWDPTKPESTPAPPGGGNKYLDLRLIALGQHVTVNGLTEKTQVQDVIALLRNLTIPTPPQIPVGGPGQPVFMPQNSWFVALDFGVLKVEEQKPSPALPARYDGGLPAVIAAEPVKPPVYFMQLSIVFNDPVLYALRVALDGPMAKIFAGLDFQIMYRQVSDTVGCYSAQIALPNIMRKFQVGVATITLPVFAIQVYTNGDFQLDIGFPWNMDFSRSFGIEAIIPPGIPVTGAGGFYFGKLSSATTDKVPKATNGWFNPVIVFGFGAQIGLGKSIEAGILRAGFSLTVFGIIEGVVARFLPYTDPTPLGNPNNLQDGYYFALAGTVGVQGRLYGSIDFAIIKADVDVSISLFIRFTFVAYEDITIAAGCSVRVKVSLKIDLGLFSFSISFSFSADVSATFVLQNPMGNNPPWHVPQVASSALRLTRLRAFRSVTATALLEGISPNTYNPTWSNLAPGAALRLSGWVVPVLTVAGDIASTPAQQVLCYAVNFLLPVPDPVHAAPAEPMLVAAANGNGPSTVAHAALRRALADPVDATFEDFAVRVLQWVLAAGIGPMAPDGVNNEIVTSEFLHSALAYLTGDATPVPVPPEVIEPFLAQQTEFVFSLNQSAGSSSATFFPAPPGTLLEVPAFPPDGKAYKYTFGGYNTSSSGYLESVTKYFNALKVQVQQEQQHTQRAMAAPADTGPSIAGYIFGDYFALIGRQSVQALIERQSLQALIGGLTNYKLLIDSGKTVAGIVGWINTTGDLPEDKQFSAEMLFRANDKHTLSVKASGPLTISGMTWQSPGGLSFQAIAGQAIFSSKFTGRELAQQNAANGRIIAAGVGIACNGKSYTTQSGDSLMAIAAFFDVTIDDLLDKTDVVSNAALLSPLAVVTAPDFKYTIASGDTLGSVAGHFAVTTDLLAGANGGVSGLFDAAGDPNLNVPELPQFRVGELIDEAKRTLAFQNISAMASRFYLHGLRLPTAGLTAEADGLFVTGSPGNFHYPDELGLFALTGQAFPVPANIPDAPPTPFSFTLTRGGAEPWLNFQQKGGETLQFQLTDVNDVQRYKSVRDFALSNVLNTGMSAIAPLACAAASASTFPLSQQLYWQTPAPLTLPHQTVTPANPQPCLWPFPDALINLPNSRGPLPTVEPVLARTIAATGSTVDVKVSNYGFGNLTAFSIRRTPPADASPVSARMYEIIGATERDIILLERLLDQLGGSSTSFAAMTLLYRPVATGSQPAGWQSDDPSASLMGISQVNLSTETHPPTPSLEAVAAAPDLANVINTPNEFLRLLWEASITRSGGFYLSYTMGVGSPNLNGLPDHIFDDRDTAEVAVLSLFASNAAKGQAIANYVNVGATNEAFDLSDAALIARGVPVATTTPPVSAQDSLLGLAARYYTDAGVIAASNPGTTLSGTVNVSGGVYEVPAAGIVPGGRLTDIAQHFNTTADAIKAANPNRTQWPDVLPQYSGLALPSIPVRIGTDPGGQNFASLSTYYNAPIAEIAAANLTTPGLLAAGNTLSLQMGPLSLAPLIQAGVAGFATSRTAPALPASPTDANWAKAYLLQIFNLLGYRVAGNPDFRQSPWGLPGGPADPNGNAAADKIAAPEPAAAGDIWNYTRTAPYPTLYDHVPKRANSLLPDPSGSPYLGAGHVLQFELVWQDLFGNLIRSELSEPQDASQTPLNQPPQVPGYTDRIIPLGQWPAVANAYLITTGKDGKPVLQLQLSFDETQYSSGSAGDQIRRAIAIYSQIIWQLSDPNGIDIALTTTVTPSAGSILTAGQKAQLVGWVDDIYLWLQSLLTSPSTPYSLNPDLAIAVPIDETKLNTDQIFQIVSTLTISRNPQLVAGELSTAAGVASASTTLAPWTGGLTAAAKSDQREISAFAKAFRAAFTATPGISYHVATGSDRNAFTSVDNGSLWAVQLGSPDESAAISYTVTSEARIFAPRPVSNKLASRSQTPIIPYRTGKVIGLDDPAGNTAFNAIDLDQWMSYALTSIDALLTTKYVAPAGILRQKTGVDAMQSVLDAKKALAGALKGAMIPVFKDETATKAQQDAIQEAFYQMMLGQVSQFYAVKAGIQFDTSVNSALPHHPGETDPPRLYGDLSNAAAAGASTRSSNLSLSSPKLNLKFAEGDAVSHFLSFLLSSTTDSATVPLELTYTVSNIEHEIGNLEGIKGYQPSSWLSFADDTRSAAWPLNEHLGKKFEVPIVLRTFPQTPVLTLQQVETALTSACHKPSSVQSSVAAGAPLAVAACPKPGTSNPLAGVTVWNYAFSYSQQVHFLQDEIYGEIHFNTVQFEIGLEAAQTRDLFDNLAEFVQVYPLVQADLDTFLAPLDVTTTDQTQITNARTALQSAANLIQWIADTAHVFNGDRRSFALTAETIRYAFTINEVEVDKVDPDGKSVKALQVVVTLPGPPPPALGTPLVQIQPDLYDCEPDGSGDNVWRFVYKNRSTGFYLTTGEGRNIAGRTFVLPDIDILEGQSAQTSVYLTRNRVLAGRPIADVFVYTTPEVSFPDPLLPTLTVDRNVDLAAIFAQGDTPVTRSLECQLSCLYDVLFEHAGTDSVTLAMTTYYEYTLSDSLPPVRLPVFLMAPTLTAIRAGGTGTPLADVIASQSSGIRAWFNSVQPVQTNARLWMELTIMSNLTGKPMPLLKLTSLNLGLQNIDPPL